MKPLLGKWGFWPRLMSLIVIVLLLMLIATVASIGFGMLIYGRDDVMQQTVPFLQFAQAVMSVLMFIVPAFVFAILFDDTKVLSSLTINQKPQILNVLICIGAMLVSMPLVGWLEEVNLGMSLPDCMKSIEDWMRSSEETAKEMTDKLMSCGGPRCLISNIVVIALIAAVGEELFFRATFQKNLLQSTTGIRPWICVLIAAFVFSAFHLQFFGFLPRFVLGAVLGFMFLWTGNIWCSVICHFINNAMAVILYDSSLQGAEQQNPQWMESPFIIILSALLTVGTMYLLWKRRK